jgi:hypothetical protein
MRRGPGRPREFYGTLIETRLTPVQHAYLQTMAVNESIAGVVRALIQADYDRRAAALKRRIEEVANGRRG